LNQEGIFGDDDNDYDFESGPNEFPLVLDEELDVRPKKNKQRSRSKSPSRTRNMKEVPTVVFQKSINPRIPFKTLREDGSISSTSVSGNSSSSGSSHVDRNREVGGKTKRRSSNKINRKKNSQKAKQIQKGEKKAVRFSNFDHTFFIPHILDFTPEEIESIWMDEQEYRSIRSRSLTLIEMMEDEKKYPISADYMIVNKHLVCVRGLGEKTTLCTRELDRMQRKLYKAVFRTQEELREEGIIDPEAIRQASKKYSKKSLKTARFVGISDEVNVASKFG
jgi:hypothetical protein